MKITRARLRQLINEEVSKAIHEATPASSGAAVTLASLLKPSTDSLAGPTGETPKMVQSIKDAVDKTFEGEPFVGMLGNPNLTANDIVDTYMSYYEDDLSNVDEKLPWASDVIENHIQLKVHKKIKELEGAQRKDPDSVTPADAIDFFNESTRS